MMRTFALFVKSMRVNQWVKNTFIFAPMIFSLRFLQVDYIKKSLLAFFLFSLVTGAIYIFNDCFDKKKDRLHPDKRNRPIASGALKIPTALVGACFILAAALTAIFKFNLDFFIIAVVYILMNILYSYFLKNIVILDVMVIAVGFVLRVKIGGDIDNIELSVWILIITFLLAIFLGLIKRRQELLKMNNTEGNMESETRKTLKKYNLSLLDQLISITTATTLISYIIYVANPNVLEKFNTKDLYLTVPFVVFGVFRYLYLTYSEGKGENPAEILFSDLPFTINIILWLVVFLAVIFY